MYIEEIINYGDDNYSRIKAGACSDCMNSCGGDCEECLRCMFFENDERRYDCNNITNYYLCKYLYRYSSEIEYLVNQVSPLNQLRKFKLMSIGCGPCSDLFGFLNYIENNDIEKPLSFLGIDLNDIWKPIHCETESLLEDNDNINVSFIYRDIFKIIRRLKIDKNTWKPNILSFQYVISDMILHEGKKYVNSFIDDVIDNIVFYMPENSFIILNDINHNKKARDCFDYFEQRMKQCYTKTKSYKYHFLNNNGNKYTFPYGCQHDDNNITMEVPEEIEFYSPWMFCASAQLVLHKRE